MISRAIYLEIRNGNRVDGKDYVYLDVFNGTEACPRGIEITRHIDEVQREMIFRRM